jgi:Tol biopolymer transport system component
MNCSEMLARRLSSPFVLALAAVLAASSMATAEDVRLTHDGRLKRDPRFVHGGDQIVYSVVESPTLMRLMRLDVASGKIMPVYPQASTSQFESTFSPDDRYHAFVEFRGVTNVKLVIRDTREGRDVLFDPGSDRAHLGNPCFDPRGGRLIFSLPKTVGQQIVSINMQGEDRHDLTPHTDAIDDWAVFSPDGRQIALGSSRDGDFEIFVIEADGANPRRLTDSPGVDMRPAWSPDSRRLAFTSMRDGNYEIYAIGADGSNLRRLTHHAERDDFAQWHPDGKHLLRVAERDGEFDLCPSILANRSWRFLES